MSRARRASTVVLVALAALGACHRSAQTHGPAGSKGTATAVRSDHSGLPGSLELRELNADQRRTICDWTAQQYGGYGTSVPCGGDGKIATRVPRDQISCVTSFERIRCDVTVAQAEACTAVAAKDVCRSVETPPAECKVEGC